MRSPGGLSLAVLGLGAAHLGACRSADEHRRDADQEVYEIVHERRAALSAGEPFTIDPPEDSLRERLLAGAELEPLTLEECLRIAAENSREYRDRREALYLSALDLTLERWTFSVQETGTFGAFLEGTGREAESAGLLSNLGLSKLLGTGMRIVGDVGLDLVRDVGRGDGWDAVSNLSLNVTQPLLRGFGEHIVREPLTQAERDVLYEARRYERFRRTFTVEVADRFFEILQLEDQLQNEEQNFEGITRLRERNEAFAEAGLLNEIEVDQARQDELRAQNRLIDVRRDLAGRLDDFKFFLGLPVDVELAIEAGDELELERWHVLGIELVEEVCVEIALAERLDHLTTLDRVGDAERRVRVAADALRAGLDVSVAAAATSAEGRPLDFSNPDFAWGLGVDFDAPFDRLPERNVYRASLVALEEARRASVESADGIRSGLRDSLRRLEAARKSYEIQRGAVTLAERRVESAELNLEAGRASTRDVLESQEALVQARNAASSALTGYILSGLALYRDMELLRVAETGIVVHVEPIEARMEREAP